MYANDIYRFVDRDMFMRYRGGGVGHLVTRFCNKKLAMDKHPIPHRRRSTQTGNLSVVDKDTQQPGFEGGSDGDEEEDIDKDNREDGDDEDEDTGNENKDEDEDEDEDADESEDGWGSNEDEDEDEGAGKGEDEDEDEDGQGSDKDEDEDGDEDRVGDQRFLSMLGYGAL